MSEEMVEIIEEVVKSTDNVNKEINGVEESGNALKIFEDKKFYKPTQIANTLSVSPMTVIRSLDRNKTPFLCDPSQKKKIRLYRGKDLNSFYVFSKND
jgi:hypothetical protein